MEKIICENPSTFLSFENDILVYDENENLFFFHPNNENFINFNLPKGVFYTDNYIHKKTVFTPYKEFLFNENFINDKLEDYELITHLENKNKATINTLTKTIKIDNQLYNHDYKPLSVFLLGHEIGHLFSTGDLYIKGKKVFDSEKFCDEFSENWMLANGYNPSQIKIASHLLLKNSDRKKCIKERNSLKKYRR